MSLVQAGALAALRDAEDWATSGRRAIVHGPIAITVTELLSYLASARQLLLDGDDDGEG